CLEEAAILHSGSQLRALFIIILTQYTSAYPKELWLYFRINICDNLQYRLCKKHTIDKPTDEQIFDFGLFLLDELLYQSNQSFSMFLSISLWMHNWEDYNGNYIIVEQLAYNYQEPQDIVNSCIL
ncbi:10439_t:CDS:1, partial [Acaulospora morrowiae]